MTKEKQRQIVSTYRTGKTDNDILVVELQEKMDHHTGWQVIKEEHFTCVDDEVLTPRDYDNTLKGAENFARDMWGITDDLEEEA